MDVGRKEKERKRKAPILEESPKKKRKSSDSAAISDSEDVSKAERKAKKEAKRLRKWAKQLASSTTADDIEQYLKSNSITIHEPAGSSIVPLLDFTQLAVPDSLKVILEGFDKPTPIQSCTWPALLAGLDVIGIAETGSGKTLAFCIPGMARLISQQETNAGKKHISALVVSPTRELAIQTYETIDKLGKLTGITSVCVYGGVSKGEQVRELKRLMPGILVGTPGRILDLVNDGNCDLSNVNYLVLDEADRMLDKGFENDIRRMMEMSKSATPLRQTVMFSATWPDSVKQLASTFLRNPVRIIVGSDELAANKRVTQAIEVFDDPRTKDGRLFALLRKLFSHHLNNKSGSASEPHRVLVFVLYKKEAARVEYSIRRNGYSVAGLHGDLSQQDRISALNGFKDGTTQILVATDVAARGLDIPNVQAVINYSFPLTVEDYVHRIGRTGRGGQSGQSITFFTGENHERALAGELARVLRESGADTEPLKKFPMTVKKKEHSAYGAFFRDDIEKPAEPQKIKF